MEKFHICLIKFITFKDDFKLYILLKIQHIVYSTFAKRSKIKQQVLVAGFDFITERTLNALLMVLLNF